MRRPGRRPRSSWTASNGVSTITRAWRAVRAGRRHDRAVGGRRVAAVRAGDRAADDSPLHREAPPQDDHPYGFKATFNATYPGDRTADHGWISPWHLRHQPGADRADDRELPVGLLLGPHETLSADPRGLAPCWMIGGWLSNDGRRDESGRQKRKRAAKRVSNPVGSVLEPIAEGVVLSVDRQILHGDRPHGRGCDAASEPSDCRNEPAGAAGRCPRYGVNYA